MKVMDRLKRTIRSWLNIQETSPVAIQIDETMDFEQTAILNRIWYRGDSNELEQVYGQINLHADKWKFWAGKPTPGMEIRKIHSGLPKLIVKTLSDIVIGDLNDFRFEPEKHKDTWEKIDKENQFKKLLSKALKEILFVGDGAFKISLDPEISAQPIIEFFPGDRVEFEYKRGKIREVIFKTPFKHGKKRYLMNEHYGFGYVRYVLYEENGEEDVPLDTLPETAGLKPVEFDKGFIMAVPFRIYENSKWEGRGGSIFEAKIDNFDALDEAWSQWMDALRAGRSRTYIPEDLIPKSPATGELIKPNAFDNRFIKIATVHSEGADNKIDVEQPSIPHDSYLATYITALDLCLQGIISPSTLGIDVKKLDNAEAQREKEKATLYTRNAIIEALQETLPAVISAAINTQNVLQKKEIEEIEVESPFGEYANPSFESQVETLGKARPGSPIMSIEAQVEELWGDSKDADWKKKEVVRLKTEAGIEVIDEPSVAGQDLNLFAAGD